MASDICIRFGRRVRQFRKKRGWTQVYLAQHTGLGSVYISQLEHGKKEPGLRTIEILAMGFDVTPAQLLTGISSPLVQTEMGLQLRSQG
jgi:transcriptional regulator with XRE-family HTH domain